MAIVGGDITKAFAEGFDGWREAFELTNVELKLLEKKSGQPTNTLLATISTGWKFSQERIRGQIEGLFKIQVIDQGVLTADVMKRCNRIEWGDSYCGIDSYDAPKREPRIWTFFTKEIKTGAIK